jgi:hypothetical protein
VRRRALDAATGVRRSHRDDDHDRDRRAHAAVRGRNLCVNELAFVHAVERASSEAAMERLAAVVVLIAFAAVSLPAVAGPNSGAAPASLHAKNCVPSRSAEPAPRDARTTAAAPPVRVCVGDADTQLNLPWFLTDVLTAIDTHQSAGDLLHKMRNDF